MQKIIGRLVVGCMLACWLTSNTDAQSTPSGYGTNLWFRLNGISSSNLVGIISNTIPDVYFDVQSKFDLIHDTQWVSTGFGVYGSELTNWTALVMTNLSRTNKAFFRIRSWVDDGSGLPIWWQMQYFGTTGVDPYGDPMGDGWNNLQKFQNGMNPNVFYTPPAPQGLTVSYNANTGVATVSWQPSPGMVTGYTVERDVGYWSGGNTEDFNISAGANDFGDNVSSVVPDPFDGAALDVSYQVQAQYGTNGVSAWSDSVPLEPNTISANFVAGPQGSAYVTTSPLPSGTTALQVTLIDEGAWFNYLVWGIGNEPSNPTFDIPVTNPTQYQYLIPASDSVVPPAADGGSYFWYVQTVNTNGSLGEPCLTLSGSDSAAPPYSDGRAQLKQNLIFLLRAATVDSPFNYIEINTNNSDYYTFTNPPNYVYAGFYQLDEIANGCPSYEENVGSFDAYWPFENNYRYRNFVLNSTNLDSSGRITTGAGGDYYYNLCWVWNLYWMWEEYPGGLMLVDSPAFQFQPPTTNGATIPSLLATNNTRWLVSYALDSASSYLWKIGATNYAGVNGLFNNVRNWYGLPFLSVNLSGTTTLNAGNTTTAGGYFYPETAQPLFQTIEYDFWSYSPVPGSSGFSTTNTSDPLIASVGNSITVNGYAKLAVTNGYPGVYAYLGQYFDQAYQIDTNGVVTTNTTGALSPYGSFFATQPGPVALVTMPDVDTGARGTCTVYCVSLQLDKNHDGNMDLSFSGPDATSQASPYVVWINNWRTVPGTSGNLDQDVPIPPSHPEYANYFQGKITCQRDLENFFRLWICGVPQLPASQGYTVTMSMSPVSGNPAINLYYSCETNGGTKYLTDTNVAATQTGSAYYANELGTISSSQSYTLPMDGYGNLLFTHYLFEGAGIGSGELVMTISQNGNTIAQTGVWLDLHDVKDFYERAVITNNISGAISNWTSGVEIVKPAISSLGDDTNLIVLVHGINVDNVDWLDESDTVFKRLYWAGYHGKFATVKWPCNPINFSTFLTLDTDDFNNSEAKAYKASMALTNYLSPLRARFPGYRLHLLVHSQGNAVVSEAIQRGGVSFDTYILTQGALPDSAYDVDAPINTDIASHDYGTHITPEWQPMGYHGIYTNFTGRIVNFYNQNDPVLDYWVDDQKFLKPTFYPDTSFYYYDGVNSYYDPVIGFNRLITDPEESRAMVSRSRTSPIGQSGPASAHGVIQSAVDLYAKFGFYNAFPDDHSAQWTWPIQTTRPYFQQVLTSCQIQPAP